MKKIYILNDYKGFFGSKNISVPYRSGMDKNKLELYFRNYEYHVKYLEFANIDFMKMNFKNKFVLYTSSEDVGYYYKGYIEDIVLGLDLQGAYLIPEFKFLRANNNKVFSEILRKLMSFHLINNIKSHCFGVIEELEHNLEKVDSRSVIKQAAGAMSSGVCLSEGKTD